MENTRFIMKESTEKLVKEAVGEDFENLSDQELMNKLNKTKKFVVRLTESGQLEIKQVLLG